MRCCIPLLFGLVACSPNAGDRPDPHVATSRAEASAAVAKVPATPVSASTTPAADEAPPPARATPEPGAPGDAVFEVRDFSKQHWAHVVLTATQDCDDDSCGGEGFIIVYGPNNEELFRVGSRARPNQLHFDVNDGKPASNVRQLPYGEHSLIISDDFDFDGDADLAIRDGDNGCYGGPSFDVHLKSEDGFVRSPELAELTVGFCGLFQVDAKHKQLRTMTKSGCCWHEYTTYDVVDGKPRAIEVVTETLEETTEKRLVREKWVVKRTRKPPAP